jgi:hypothetical protein
MAGSQPRYMALAAVCARVREQISVDGLDAPAHMS